MGDYHHQQRGRWGRFSTPALREEGDLQGAVGKLQVLISIHALREEGDTLYNKGARNGTDFYPRPPRGGRPGRGNPH